MKKQNISKLQETSNMQTPSKLDISNSGNLTRDKYTFYSLSVNS